MYKYNFFRLRYGNTPGTASLLLYSLVRAAALQGTGGGLKDSGGGTS